jgi:hypothetical protein
MEHWGQSDQRIGILKSIPKTTETSSSGTTRIATSPTNNEQYYG